MGIGIGIVIIIEGIGIVIVIIIIIIVERKVVLVKIVNLMDHRWRMIQV